MKNQNLDKIIFLVKQWFTEQYQDNLELTVCLNRNGIVGKKG
jgi:hypothetical protein